MCQLEHGEHKLDTVAYFRKYDGWDALISQGQALYLSWDHKQAAVQRQGLKGSPVFRVQRLAGDVTLLLAQQLHIGGQADDVALCLCIALWPHKQQPTQHSRQRQVEACADSHTLREL